MPNSSLLLLLTLCTAHLTAFAAEKPNVIVLFIDDMGYADPSCFGNPLVQTPHIDSLAADGIKLTNFYVNSPICSASRTALSTGQYQQRWRINSFLNSRNSQKKRKMADYLETSAYHTAQVFKDAGYRTAHFGKWHLGGGRDVDDAPHPTAYGFDESYVSFEGLGDRLLFENGKLADMSAALGQGEIIRVQKRDTTRIYVDKAIEYISRVENAPFYLEVFPNDVHDAFLPSPEAVASYSEITDNIEEQKFLAVLVEMDRQIGRLLIHLKEEGLSNNTLVIFTSDNGPTDWPRYYNQGITPPGFTGPFFGRKWSLYEGGIRMPFIARWPGRIPAGTEDQQSVVAAIDLQQTLASLAGIETPSGKSYDGLDRSGVLLGTPSPRTEPLYWEYGIYGTLKPGKAEHESPVLAMRQGSMKYLSNPDGSNAQLYDLSQDPGEKNNLLHSLPKTSEKMRSSLLAWWSEMETYFSK